MSPTASRPEKTVDGTSITESSMKKMLAHNRELTGGVPRVDKVDHRHVAESMDSARPDLLRDYGNPNPQIRASRVTEGVQGTSPTPGQDSIAYVPPTTSNTANPGDLGKGPDAENEPATASQGQTRQERLMREISALFAEDDEEPAPANLPEGTITDEEQQPVNEVVEVRCESCGYEETYDLSEESLAEGNVPLTANGQLDTRCPLCGANMDMSLIGATNQGEVTDPNPRTDVRGNSVPVESIEFGRKLTQRVLEGADVDLLAKQIVSSDFMKRRRVA